MDNYIHLWNIGAMARSAPIRRSDPTPAGRRSDPAERRRKSGPALRAFFNIAAKWGLTPEEQRGLLGWPSRSALYLWRSSGDKTTLPYDTLIRLSLVLGIFKDLHILYPEVPFADAWVRTPNRNLLFGGRSPVEHVLHGGIGALYDIRRLLDARRGGWS